MPQILKDKLAAKNIEQITSTFWATNYDAKDSSSLSSSASAQNGPLGSFLRVFRTSKSCSHWLQLWTRRLIIHAKGPLKSLFHSSRLVLR